MVRKSLCLLVAPLLIHAAGYAAEPAGKPFTFGLLLVGPYNDRGWSQAHYDAGLYVERKLPGTRMIYLGKVNPAERPGLTLPQLVDDLVAKGARLIIANSDDMKDGARESAKKHPEVTVIHVSGDDVLTLLCRDLAYFLGHPFARKLGPELPVWSLPGISALPFLGVVLGRHTPVVYLSLILIPLLWWWVFRTRPGLELRAVGEKPQAAFARGIRVHYLRILYTLVGGALVGLAGGAFSLAVKPGWGRPQGAEGAGWIALALVIFGDWHPVRAALGAYLFSVLQVLGITLQEHFPGLPAPLFQVSPFPVMILTLLVVNMGRTGWVQDLVHRYPGLRSWVSRWQATAPAALGRDFQPEKEN